MTIQMLAWTEHDWRGCGEGVFVGSGWLHDNHDGIWAGGGFHEEGKQEESDGAVG